MVKFLIIFIVYVLGLVKKNIQTALILYVFISLTARHTCYRKLVTSAKTFLIMADPKKVESLMNFNDFKTTKVKNINLLFINDDINNYGKKK